MFGWKDERGGYHPFHIYSMRQAIEEGFILDVLKNYMTYKMYYKIVKAIPDNPEMDTTTGAKAILDYETLHPHNISQKTAVMLEHFYCVTKTKIGGKAKAMVVTPSRLHAVRYLQEFRRQILEKGYDLDVLVAFSGEIEDDGQTFTEEKLNKTKDGKTVKEKALPKMFHTDEFGMLIVAEKYQTGFDEPLLHTMFVDKKLSGVKAVQTLSRLNRTCRGKQDTFILDFVNSAEDIHKLSVYAKFLLMQLPKGSMERVNMDDKVLLEYYRLEKDFEGSIELERAEDGFRPITGEAGRKDKKKNPLTVIIDKINDRYGTEFTEMDKVLLQIESDYEAQDKWYGYAQNNDFKTFMLLFEKDFPNMAASRYEQNEEFFVRMFKEPDMMKQIMETLGTVLYEKLKRKSDIVYSFEPEVSMVAEDVPYGRE